MTQEPLTKTCSKCHLEKPVEEFVYRRCRACRAAASQAYCLKHAEKRRAYNREWRKKNPEKVLAHNRARPRGAKVNSKQSAANRKTYSAKRWQQIKADPELAAKERATMQEWREKNRDRYREQQRRGQAAFQARKKAKKMQQNHQPPQSGVFDLAHEHIDSGDTFVTMEFQKTTQNGFCLLMSMPSLEDSQPRDLHQLPKSLQLETVAFLRMTANAIEAYAQSVADGFNPTLDQLRTRCLDNGLTEAEWASFESMDLLGEDETKARTLITACYGRSFDDHREDWEELILFVFDVTRHRRQK